MGWRRGTPGRLIRAWWRFLDLVEHWYWSASFEIWQLIPLRWRKVKVKAAPPPPEEEEYPWDPDPELDEWDTEPPLQFSIEPSEFEVGPTSEMFN